METLIIAPIQSFYIQPKLIFLLQRKSVFLHLKIFLIQPLQGESQKDYPINS